MRTFPRSDIPGNGENGVEDGDDGGDPCDEVPCKAQGRLYGFGGRIVLCEQLEVVEIQVLAPPEQPPAVESGPDADEPVEEEEATVDEVSRPRCAPGTQELTVVGLDFDALAGVETSEDGLAAWTPTPIELRGRIVDGTFVVAE